MTEKDQFHFADIAVGKFEISLEFSDPQLGIVAGPFYAAIAEVSALQPQTDEEKLTNQKLILRILDAVETFRQRRTS